MLRFSCVALFALTLAAAHAAVTHGQPLEQKRPYQFGFTVDQQQHRFEKQDERGIVMGEFGFITADGIYHVTVYATDEEGKFRILAMKSYPYESPPKTIEMVVRPKQTPPATTASPPPKFNPNKIACSGCFIPEDTAKDTAKDTAEDTAEGAPPKSAKTPIRTLSQSLGPEEGPNARSPGSTGGGPSTVLQSIAQTSLNNAVREAKRPSQRAGAPATTTHAHDSAPDSNTNSLTPSQLAVNSFKLDTNRFEGSSTPGRPAGGSSFNSPATPDGAAGTRTNNRGAPAGTEVAAEAETATGNARTPAAAPSGGTRQTPVRNAASGGSSGGLGSAASTDAGDLYRFKYLLDYNGHTETGARDGSKQGSFFAIGDDNVRRTIEYVANEFGFQPRISWRKLEGGVKLPLENALKDYEFVWFRRD